MPAMHARRRPCSPSCMNVWRARVYAFSSTVCIRHEGGVIWVLKRMYGKVCRVMRVLLQHTCILIAWSNLLCISYGSKCFLSRQPDSRYSLHFLYFITNPYNNCDGASVILRVMPTRGFLNRMPAIWTAGFRGLLKLKK